MTYGESSYQQGIDVRNEARGLKAGGDYENARKKFESAIRLFDHCKFENPEYEKTWKETQKELADLNLNK